MTDADHEAIAQKTADILLKVKSDFYVAPEEHYLDHVFVKKVKSGYDDAHYMDRLFVKKMRSAYNKAEGIAGKLVIGALIAGALALLALSTNPHN